MGGWEVQRESLLRLLRLPQISFSQVAELERLGHIPGVSKIGGSLGLTQNARSAFLEFL